MQANERIVAGDLGHCCGADCPGFIRGRWLKYARTVVPQIRLIRAEHARRRVAVHRRKAVLLWGRPVVVASFWQTQAAIAMLRATQSRDN